MMFHLGYLLPTGKIIVVYADLQEIMDNAYSKLL